MKLSTIKQVLAPLALCVLVTGGFAAAMALGSSAGAINPKALPLGDNHYSTSGAKRGYIYLCHVMPNPAEGGAFATGPWVKTSAGTYDSTSKPTVDGDVSWPGSVSIGVSGGRRVISGNGLPTKETTGTFPISSGDDAYRYDRNPNTVRAQNLSYSLPAKPRKGSPQCEGGSVGIATNGVQIFNAFDASYRDANAYEIQDQCDGHPQMSGNYHYHSIPSCLYSGESTKKPSGVVGWAFDGFPITGPRGAHGKLLTDNDLDVCHGTTSKVRIDGKMVRTYHYVATQEFPYTVSCFRGTEIASNVPR